MGASHKAFLAGVAASEAGDSNKAKVLYKEALELGQHSGAWVNLGAIHHEQGDLQTALDCYDKALEVSPDYALAHFNRANAWDELASFAFIKAEQSYLASIENNPAYLDAHYNLGRLYCGAGRFADGFRHLWIFIGGMAPSDPWRANALALVQNCSDRMTENGQGPGGSP